MSVLTAPSLDETIETIDAPDLLESNPSAGPTPLRWTRDEYERLFDQGFFGNRRVQLIEGEIVEMPAHKGPHVTSIGLTGKALENGFGPGHVARHQVPLNLGERSSPEPDVAIVVGGLRDFTDRHPSTALLVAEISDTTLRFDLGRKAILYSRGGIPEYWVIDLTKRRLVVHRQPDPANGTWGERIEIAEDGTVSPLAKPDLVIRVGDLLP